MADKRDYYEVLGVDKNATQDEIKSAFRKQAKTCHPDLHPGDTEAEAKFKEINEAAEVLGDPQKRAQYDQFGHAAFDQGAGGGNPFQGGYSGFGGFGDIFETMFGGGFGSERQRNGPMAGDDLRQNVTISFEEAAFGVKREILVARDENCATCSGTGAKPGTSPITCPTCHGSGQVRVQQNTMFGAFASVRPCTECKGTGQIIKEPCTDCKGTGRIRKTSRIVVNIPAGIDNGQILNVRGEGDAGYRGGPKGDLYVHVTVRPHKLFKRVDFDLHHTMHIPYTTAVLGGEITVPTLTGAVKYNVPEGTQTGTTFRLRDQGIKHLHSNSKGDLLVKVEVEVPRKLTEQQKDLLQQLAESMGDTGAGKGHKNGIFGKKKENR